MSALIRRPVRQVAGRPDRQERGPVGGEHHEPEDAHQQRVPVEDVEEREAEVAVRPQRDAPREGLDVWRVAPPNAGTITASIPREDRGLLHLALSPVLLGEGEHLFFGMNLHQLGFAPGRTVAGENATRVLIGRK